MRIQTIRSNGNYRRFTMVDDTMWTELELVNLQEDLGYPENEYGFIFVTAMPATNGKIFHEWYCERAKR